MNDTERITLPTNGIARPVARAEARTRRMPQVRPAALLPRQAARNDAQVRLAPPAWLRALLVAAALPLAGCAAITAAEVELPATVAARPAEPVTGIGAGRSGRFEVGPLSGTFTRGRDRLDLFEVVSWEKAATRYRLALPDGATVEAACHGRAVEVQRRALAVDARPYAFQCDWRGARSATLTVEAPALRAGLQEERRGRFTLDGRSLEVASIHQVRGSRLPVAAPLGYLFSVDGRPVGAVELNGTPPRLWRPAADDPLHEAVTLAALALALTWDPAGLR